MILFSTFCVKNVEKEWPLAVVIVMQREGEGRSRDEKFSMWMEIDEGISRVVLLWLLGR